MSDYRHIDKDPIIDLIRTEFQNLNGGKIPAEFIERVAVESGVSVGTIRNWLFGDTRRPQHLTVRFVLDAIGCKLQVVRKDGTIVRGPKHVGHSR